MNSVKVFISSRDSTCDECDQNLGRRAWITLNQERAALCLPCADLDHLIFLPSGDAALTRRACKHSSLSAVVLKWSSARKRYERQGILVTGDALDLAEQECLADHVVRTRRQQREAARRAELDQEYVRQFAAQVQDLFPHCPLGRVELIAEHACLKYSGRIGRSAAAKSLDENAVCLAVVAHIRHTETRYDELLAQGWDRQEARAEVNEQVCRVLVEWETRKRLGPGRGV